MDIIQTKAGIIRAKHWDLNDSIHEVIMDINERMTIHDLPSIGMFETNQAMLIDDAPVTTVSILPEDKHLLAILSHDQSNGSVMVYDMVQEKGNPRKSFKKTLQISYLDNEASLSRVSLIVAGYCFWQRSWFDGKTREENEEKVENFARRYWPGFTDEAIALVQGLFGTLTARENKEQKELRNGPFIFSW